MPWQIDFHASHPIAHTILVLALVAAAGLVLGSVEIRGIRLGVAGVLFTGIAFGHFGIGLESAVLAFVRDFGLVLFVYMIGMQVGPGFLTSLRRNGVKQNALAALIVFSGAAIALLLSRFGKVDIAAATGIFAGATTNTPALGAAQEALKNIAGVEPERLALPALGYSIAYPLGVAGIVVSMVLLRGLFRINSRHEIAALQADEASGPLQRMNIQVEHFDGVKLRRILHPEEGAIVVSRIQSGEAAVSVARLDTVVRRGDILLAVGPAARLEEFQRVVGSRSEVDLASASGRLTSRKVFVTRKDAVGRTLGEIEAEEFGEISITRVRRGEVEMAGSTELRLQFGDRLLIVGYEAAVARATEILGNLPKALHHTNFIAIFLGIALGVLVGCIPFHLPGFSAPVSLGLAGGPLLVALILSNSGRIGPVVSYMPANANLALREFGIVLFLACVALKAGEHFVDLLFHGDGLFWMSCGVAITVLPLLLAGAVARLGLRMNFIEICGLLAGSMTDPPALAFASSISESDAPAVAYAAVYPLTMLLRIIVAQAMILFVAA